MSSFSMSKFITFVPAAPPATPRRPGSARPRAGRRRRWRRAGASDRWPCGRGRGGAGRRGACRRGAAHRWAAAVRSGSSRKSASWPVGFIASSPSVVQGSRFKVQGRGGTRFFTAFRMTERARSRGSPKSQIANRQSKSKIKNLPSARQPQPHPELLERVPKQARVAVGQQQAAGRVRQHDRGLGLCAR